MEQKEITAHLMGGMGNLLFIVATSFALSKKYKTKLRLYCNSTLWRDSKRQNIKKYKMFEKFDIDCVNNRKSGITYREPHFFYDSGQIRIDLLFFQLCYIFYTTSLVVPYKVYHFF